MDKQTMPRVGFGLNFAQAVVWKLFRVVALFWVMSQLLMLLVPLVLQQLPYETYEFMFRGYIDWWQTHAANLWDTYIWPPLRPLPYHWPAISDPLPYLVASGVALVLVLLSGGFWRRVGSGVAYLRHKHRERPARPKEFKSHATGSGGDDFDAGKFEETGADEKKRDFSKAFRERMNPNGEKTERTRQKLQAVIEDQSSTQGEKETAARKLKALPPPPKQITHRR